MIPVLPLPVASNAPRCSVFISRSTFSCATIASSTTRQMASTRADNERYRKAYLLFCLRSLYLPPRALEKEMRGYDARYLQHLYSAIDPDFREICESRGWPDVPLFSEACTGKIRAIHGELLYHGGDSANARAAHVGGLHTRAGCLLYKNSY